jgi:hypothetical protein
VRPAAEAEKAGIPAVVVTTTGFTTIAKSIGKSEGIANLRVAEYPGAVGVHPEELVDANVENVLFDRIIGELTQPRSVGSKETAVAGRPADDIVFEGTFDEINAHFRGKRWSDELPVVPPTLERVAEFLKHTRREPDETIAVLPQANLAATTRNIAVNAVMAGCQPQLMPVLIAAVQAIADNEYNLNNIGSTWGVQPFLLVNGPLAATLGIENGAQLVNRGANPSIGRALALIIKNIAGYQYGSSYMGTFGYPLNVVLAENEAENPWQPYHVEHGFKRGDSTVTACGTVTWGWPPAIYGTPRKSAAQAALQFLALECTKKPCLARLVERGGNGFRNMITFLIAPPVAKALAGEGYTKDKIREYVYEHARVPARELEFLIEYGHSEAFTFPDMVERGLLPKEYLVGPDEMVRVLPKPEVISIVVCGDPDRNRVMVLWGGYISPVTKKIFDADER